MKVTKYFIIALVLLSIGASAQLVRPGITLHKKWSISADQNIYGSDQLPMVKVLCGYYINPLSSKKTGFLSAFSPMTEDTMINMPYISLNENVLYSVAISDGNAMSTIPIVSVGYEEVAPGDKDILINYTDMIAGQATKSVNSLTIPTQYNQEAKYVKQQNPYSYNFWTCGYSESSPGDKDFWIGSIFANGSATVPWDTSFGGSGEDVLNSFAYNMNGGILFTGYTSTPPALGKDIKSVLFQGGGNTISVDTSFSITGDQELNDTYFDSYYYTMISVGYSDTTGINKDFFIVCFDQMTGDTLWTKTYGTPYDDVANTVKMVDFGGMVYCYAVAGYTMSETGDMNNYMVLFDYNGNVISERIFGETGVDECTNTLFSDYDVFYLFGKSDNNQEFNELVKFNYNINSTNVACNGHADGSINFINESGFAAGNVSVDLYNSTNSYMGNGFDFNNMLSPDKYYIDFTYSFGAKASSFMRDSVIIGQPDYLDATISYTDPDCIGNLGSVTIAPFGGTPPYSLSWSTGASDTTQIDGLVAGYYEVFLTDANGCSASSGYYGATLYDHYLGLIYGSANVGLGTITENHGKAILYKIDNTGTASELDSITSSVIDLNSQYSFNNVAPGDYKILIQIDSTSYYPHYLNSYYSLNDTVISWETADTITIVCDDYYNLPINMYEMTPMESGVGSISGHIYLFTYTKQIGEPVPGAEILIEQEPNDVPVQATFTDNSGYYEVNGLEAGGLYSMEVDIPGYPMISSHVNIPITTTDTVYEDMNFYIDTTINGGIMADTLQTQIYTFTNDKFELNAYPNPFNNNVSFDFNLVNEAYIQAEILNVSGEPVKYLINEKRDKGNISIVWQPLSIPSGIYFLRVRIGNQILIKKIVYTK